jgi:hypothetical protein
VLSAKRFLILTVGLVSLVGGALSGVEPAEAASSRTVAQAVAEYAPTVYLHESDPDRPMSADNFVTGSILWWYHDEGCESSWHGPVSAIRLGTGQYKDQALDRRCHQVQTFRSNEDVRATDKNNPAGGEGFYLDVDDRLRNGDGDGTGAPVYYDVRKSGGRTVVVYWFFYGFNNFRPRTDMADKVSDGGDHEGDWEEIAVILTGNNLALGILYYRHGGPCYLPSNGSRPSVYSAKGSHASYPDPGRHFYFGSDDASDKGPVWHTESHLKPLNRQPWYGYGGGWGQVSGKGTTVPAPRGPHPQFKTGVPDGPVDNC